MTFKAIIIEDVQDYIESLLILLNQHADIDIVDIASSKDEAIDKIIKHKPDLLFCDIELNRSHVFEVLNACKEYFKYVIFTTSHDNYALKGYDFNTIDYLLKPINRERLATSIKKLHQLATKTPQLEFVQKELVDLNFIKSDKIYLPNKIGHKAVSVDKILFIKSDKSYCDVFTLDETIKVSRNLSFMLKLVEKHPQFVRVHRSFAVNSNHIINLKKGLDSFLTLTQGHEIPISLTEKDEFFKKIGIKE